MLEDWLFRPMAKLLAVNPAFGSSIRLVDWELVAKFVFLIFPIRLSN